MVQILSRHSVSGTHRQTYAAGAVIRWLPLAAMW